MADGVGSADWVPIVRDVVDLLELADPGPGQEFGQKLVFKAQHDGDAVMVKIIDVTGLDGAGTLERARREVNILGRIDHLNVVKLAHGIVEVGGDPPVAVAWLEELLDGADLWSQVDSPWTPAAARQLGVDLAGGLGAMHRQEVVHRDLSPANVFACTDGRYVVLDPGYGRHLDRSSLTGHWIVGTPGFLSPEHIRRARGWTPASDVFGVGVLLYLVLTGCLPVDPEDPDYDLALYHGQVPPIRERCPELEGGLAAIVDRCLQRQPGRRFIDGAELAEAFEAL